MALRSDQNDNNFENALKAAEKAISALSFEPYKFEKKGNAYYVQYKKGNYIVEFMYGPPEYHIDIIIHTKTSVYEFKDLLQIPAISKWANENRDNVQSERHLEGELLWFVRLLKFSLSQID